MWELIVERLRQKKRTVPYPASLPVLPPRFKGRPFIFASRCVACTQKTSCTLCQNVCPAGAIMCTTVGPFLDTGKCTFCGACAKVCPNNGIVFSTDWRLASTTREALVVHPATLPKEDDAEAKEQVVNAVRASGSPLWPTLYNEVSEATDEATKQWIYDNQRILQLPPPTIEPTILAGGAFTKSLSLRQVSAGGCNACEADLNVLTTVVFDLIRFGIDFVASPRHADGMAITGVVPANMRKALLKCNVAMPEPKVVIAVGACAISGGLLCKTEQSERLPTSVGVAPHLPVSLFIPGCPPHPYTELDALLRFLNIPTPK